MAEEVPRKTREQLDAELRDQLAALEESFTRRLAEAREELGDARTEATAEAEQLFPEGALGRVDAEPSEDILDLVQERRDLLARIQDDPEGQLSARQSETERITSEFDTLLASARDPDSAGARAARERGQLAIDKRLRANLRNVASLSQQRGIGMQNPLVSDALQGAVDAQAALERDLTIERQKAQERIVEKGASARSESLRRQEDVINTQRAQVNQLQTRLEDLQGAIRQDVLQRQQFNLEQRAAETFGRLGTIEGRTNQTLALITGARSQTLGETQAAKSNIRAEESLEIQRIEAEKPPPSGGGGKSVLCIQYWMTGDISTEILEGDFAYTFVEDSITPAVRMCYYSWASWISPYILKKGLLYKAIRPFCVAWANEMASRVGVPTAKSNWLGSLMCTIGVPAHQLAGTVMRLFGYTLDDVESKTEVQEIFGEAATIWERSKVRAAKLLGYEVA